MYYEYDKDSDMWLVFDEKGVKIRAVASFCDETSARAYVKNYYE